MKDTPFTTSVPLDEGVLFGTSLFPSPHMEDELIFEKHMGRQVPRAESPEFVGSIFSSKRALWFFIFFGATVAILFARMIWLQLWQGNNFRALAEGNRERVVPIAAERGLIYDRNSVQLTKNIPYFALAITPQDLEREYRDGKNVVSERTIEKLAELTKQDKESIRNILTEYGSYSFDSIIIQENLDYETALKLHIAAQDLPGVHIERSSKRLYLHEGEKSTATSTLTVSTSSSTLEMTSLSHVLGYLGKLNREELDQLRSSGYLPSDSLGKLGVEKTYETALRGIYGKRRVEVDTKGREQRVLSEEPPVPGYHLVLSIDVNIQSKLEEIIRQELQKQGKKRAAAVALDPRTGEVLALVNVPSFDNNDFSGGIKNEVYERYIQDKDRPLFNRAVAGGYPSGSSIKPAIALAALMEGIITPNTSFLSTGGIRVGQWFFPDWRPGGHGVTNVRWSLADSVNTFYYYIGGGYNDFEGLGVDRIEKYLKEFGFGKPTGIDISGENGGFVPGKEWKEKTTGERWYIGDTYNLSIGQGDLLVTPLQIAVFTASIANGGTVYKPHLAKRLEHPITKEVQEIKPEILKDQIAPKKDIETVQLGMRDCVTSGSCRRLSLLPFSAAGKTGTAQWNNNFEPHAWFTSYAPFENPEIVVTVLVEEGKEGSGISAPIAYEFYRWWGEYKRNF